MVAAAVRRGDEMKVGEVRETTYTDGHKVTFLVTRAVPVDPNLKKTLYGVTILESTHDAWALGESFYPADRDFYLVNQSRLLVESGDAEPKESK